VESFLPLARRRAPRLVDARGMVVIDRAERLRGGPGRPRKKLATVAELVTASRRGPTF
jgi:ferredoxin--NADP+ reductase